MVREIELARVARYERIEVCDLATNLGAQDPAQALRFFLPGAECPGYLNEHVRVRQVDGEIADLRQYQVAHFSMPEAIVKVLALNGCGLPHDERDLKTLAQQAKLFQILTDDQDPASLVTLEQAP